MAEPEAPQSLRVPFDSVPVLVRVSGPPGTPLVLFAHPFPLHGGCWDQLLGATAAAGFRAAAVDAPGFGSSPALGRRLLMDDLAQIFALAMDALHAPRALLVGSSMGGYAVQAFARLFPDRLAGAVLIGTKASADTHEARERRQNQAILALSKGAASVVDAALPSQIDAASPALPRVKELAAGATAQGVADALRGMAERPDSRASLAGWTAPALVIGGTNDKIVTAAEIDELAAGIPGAAKRMLPTGHLVFIEAEAEVEALLLSFLKACLAGNAWSRRASDRTKVEFS